MIKNLRILFFLFIGILGPFLMLNAQEMNPRFLDETWAFYNKNVQVFNNQRLGESLKFGLDKDYVNTLISEDHPVYHKPSSFYIESFSTVDFSAPINERYYQMDFDKNQSYTVAEVMIYLGEKYAGFFEKPRRDMVIPKRDAKRLVDSLDLGQATQLKFREFWYFDELRGLLVPRVMGVGFVPPKSKTGEAVMWLDFSYIALKDMGRIRMLNQKEISNLVEYLSWPSFFRHFDQIGYSTYPDQTTLYKFSTDVDAYMAKFQIDEKFRAYKADSGIRKKWKKNQVKTKTIRGAVDADHKRTGKWTLYTNEGAKWAEFEYNNDTITKEYILFYNNGTVKEKGRLIMNRKQGTITGYDTEGFKISERNYQLGTLNGASTFYFKHNKVHSRCTFQDNKLEGQYERFYENGNPRATGVFKDGHFYKNWTFHIFLNDVMCGYLKDEYQYALLEDYFDPGALDDCTATFDIHFKHLYERGCYNGVCVIPEFNGQIK